MIKKKKETNEREPIDENLSVNNERFSNKYLLTAKRKEKQQQRRNRSNWMPLINLWHKDQLKKYPDYSIETAGKKRKEWKTKQNRGAACIEIELQYVIRQSFNV